MIATVPRPVVPAGLALVLLAMLAGCAAAPKPKSQRVPVTVARAEQRNMPFALIATGSVEAIRTAAVGSQVGGVVTRVAFREGDEVGQGQLLFQLDPRPFQNTLAQAQAALDRDRAQARLARLDVERAQALLSRNVISQSEFDQKRAAADAAFAGVASDSATVNAARLALGYASIRAPIPGRTGRLLVHEGDYVKPQSSDALVTVNQTRPVRIAFTVPVGDVALITRYRAEKPAPRVIVSIAGEDSSATIEGALVFIDNAVDPSSGTLLLKGEFPNRDGRLVPGQFVNVRLVLYEQQGAIVVPSPAVTAGQQGTFVYVMNADSTVTPHPVTIARSEDEFAIVSAGLKGGEVVITDGQLRLSPGARVLVR
ncbi:MAG: efflux RND transporter periplasmic adaptor subunit [Candidatus Eisenbacteria bacterium]